MAWMLSRAFVKACGSSLCLQVWEEASSAANCSDGKRSVRSRPRLDELRFFVSGRMRDFLKPSPYTRMCGHLTANLGEVLLTSYQAGLRAKGSPPLARVPGWKIRGASSSSKCSASLPRYDRNTSSWRTPQSSGGKVLRWSSVDLPKSGMLVDGTLCPLEEWEQSTCDADSSLWPTLTKGNAHGNAYQRDKGQKGKERPTLPGMLKLGLLPTLTRSQAKQGPCESERNRRTPHLSMYIPTLVKSDARKPLPSQKLRDKGRQTVSMFLPTLCKRDHKHPNAPDGVSRRKRSMSNCGKQLPNELGQPLTPAFCEWYMGFPRGWSGLKPLGIHKYLEWYAQHGIG